MSGDSIPKARIRRRRLFRLIWIVPVMAIAVAAYLVFHRMQDHGPEITVAFSDGGGLRVGQTPVRYRGSRITVTCDAPLAVHADGKVVVTLPATFECRKGVLRVFA